MSEAPERIWTCSHLGEYGRYYPEAVEAEGEHGGMAVEYLRADHVADMLKAEREKALREAARTVLRVTRDSLPDAENVLPPDRFDEGVDAAYSAIEALIEKDATDG